MELDEVVGGHIDKLVCPEIRIFRGHRSSYKVCGYVGLAVAVPLALILAERTGLSFFVTSALIALSILTFLGLTLAIKIITGRERLVYYHNQAAALVTAAILLRILRQPVLPYLDVLILGIGAFLVFGRIGCFMVGCCYGRPHRWGVAYRQEHADAGFDRHLVGVRLFPVQALESAWVLGVTIAGSAMMLRNHSPGDVLTWYIAAYAIGRFCFEFARGDAARKYCLGFSEAQWTSFLFLCAVVWAEVTGRLPMQPWHIGAVAGLAAVMTGIGFARRLRRRPRYPLLRPHHVREVAEAIDRMSDAGTGSVDVSRTSLGVQISAGKVNRGETRMTHYTFSSTDGVMSDGTAGTLAHLILQLRHPSAVPDLITRRRGVFHLLIHPQDPGSVE